MKLAYLASKIPFPAHDGGSFASLQFIRQLAEIGKVDAFLIETAKHPLTPEAQTALNPFFKQITSVKLETQPSILGAIRALLQGKNYNLSRFRNENWKNTLETHIGKNKYDILLIDSLFAATQYAQIANMPPFFLRIHNIEHRIWQHLAENTSNPVKKFYLRQLAKTLKQEEIRILKQAQHVLTMSEEDQEWIQQTLPEVQTTLIPVPVTLAENPVIPVKAALFHLGSMDWEPNKEAVNTLLREINTDSRIQCYPLHLAGKHMNPDLKPAPNVINHGYVSDLEAFYAEAGILVSPMRSGSGIRIKILEALGRGIPVVTTPLGAAGIAVQESGIVLAETPEEFVRVTLDLLKNETLRQETGQKGFDYIRNHHRFEYATSLLKKVLGN